MTTPILDRPALLATDLETLKAMFDRNRIQYDVDAEDGTMTVETEDPQMRGFIKIVCQFVFDSNGVLKAVVGVD